MKIGVEKLKQILRDCGIQVKSHMSLIDDELAEQVKKDHQLNYIANAVTKSDLQMQAKDDLPFVANQEYNSRHHPNQDELIPADTGEKLRICPFCGCDDIMIKENNIDAGDTDSEHYVECDTCGSRTGFFPAINFAVSCWNCRSTESSLNKSIAKLEECVMPWHPYPQEKPTRRTMCAIAYYIDGQIRYGYSYWYTTTGTWHNHTSSLNIVAWHYHYSFKPEAHPQ